MGSEKSPSYDFSQFGMSNSTQSDSQEFIISIQTQINGFHSL